MFYVKMLKERRRRRRRSTNLCHTGMDLAKDLFIDIDCLLVELFRLLCVAHFEVQNSQIVGRHRHIGMNGSQKLLIDVQRPLVERHRFIISVFYLKIIKQKQKIVSKLENDVLLSGFLLCCVVFWWWEEAERVLGLRHLKRN